MIPIGCSSCRGRADERGFAALPSLPIGGNVRPRRSEDIRQVLWTAKPISLAMTPVNTPTSWHVRHLPPQDCRAMRNPSDPHTSACLYKPVTRGREALGGHATPLVPWLPLQVSRWDRGQQPWTPCNMHSRWSFVSEWLPTGTIQESTACCGVQVNNIVGKGAWCTSETTSWARGRGRGSHKDGAGTTHL